MDKITQKLKKHLKIENFPHVTKNGKWQTTRDGYWSGGFWIGILWWMHVHTGDDLFKNEAIKWLKKFESEKLIKKTNKSFYKKGGYKNPATYILIKK